MTPNDTKSDDTEQENPLAKFGGSNDFAHSCDGCGNPTNNTPIPVRETQAVDIVLCDTCETVAAQSICDCTLDTGGERNVD